MFTIALEIIFSIFVVSLLIYLSGLKEKFGELTQTGWNRLSTGLIFVLLAGLSGLVEELPFSQSLFGSSAVSAFLQIGFLILGLAWIFWGVAGWLGFLRQKREQLATKEEELDFLRTTIISSQKGNALVEILENCLRGTTSHFKTEQAAVWVIHPASQELILAAYRGLSPQLAKNLEKLALEAGIPKRITSGEIFFSSQVKSGSDSFLNSLSGSGIESIIAVPISTRQNRLGMLALFSEQKFKFEPSAVPLLSEAVSYLQDRIEFLRLNRELKRKADTLNQSITENRILAVVSGYLTSDLGLEPILDRIIWEGLKVINATVGHFFLMEGDNLEVKATLEPSLVRTKGVLSEYPLINRVVNSRSAVVERSHLLVPVFRLGKIIGILWYENKETSVSFSPREVEQAKTLANQASIAVANWQLQKSAAQAEEMIEELTAKLKDLETKQTEPISETMISPSSAWVNDINNLLAGVLGNIELLEEKLESGRLPYNLSLAESLKAIGKTTLEAARLLKQLSLGAAPLGSTAGYVQVEPPKLEQAITRGHLRVLAIDDQKMILDLLSSMLSTLGHSTDVALSGQEGLEKFRHNSFDLVITDLGMPDVSGFEVSRQIKELKPEVPVVMITGWGANFEEEELKKNGVDYLLAKPFRLEQLTETIERILLAKFKPQE